MKKVAVFFADGFEMIEALSPVDYLRRAKIEVITVAVPSNTMKEKQTVTSSHNVQIKTDMSFEEYMTEFSQALPDAVVCPGGSNGAKNLSNCPELLDHLEKCYAQGKIVSAICASPAVVLGKTSLLKGKKWTCYPGMSDCAENSDGSFFEGEKRVIVDGNLVTACACGTSEEFAMTLCDLLVGKSECERLEKSCCLR